MTLIKCSCLTGILVVIVFKILPAMETRIEQRVANAGTDFSTRMIVELETQGGRP